MSVWPYPNSGHPYHPSTATGLASAMQGDLHAACPSWALGNRRGHHIHQPRPRTPRTSVTCLQGLPPAGGPGGNKKKRNCPFWGPGIVPMAPGGPWDPFPRPECSKRWHGDPFRDIFDFCDSFDQKHRVSALHRDKGASVNCPHGHPPRATKGPFVGVFCCGEGP